MVEQISITQYNQSLSHLPVLDVRSPAEYRHAHIPKALSLPLFTDEQRAIVGTAYKQQGRSTAVMKGLDFFAPQMKLLIEQAIMLCAGQQEVVIHCWRGGMRSGAVAWLLDLYGWRVYQLKGGYKAYRHWVLEQLAEPYHLAMLGGYTGSQKTQVLAELKAVGEAVIDLESLAAHRGSAFGSLGQPPAPSQEFFENLLAEALQNQQGKCIWLEDESQRIGTITIPRALWLQMRNAVLYFIDKPFEERLQNILADYGSFEPQQLIDATLRIQKRFGPLETKTTVQHLQAAQIKDAFSLLLKYYDKQYLKSMHTRPALSEQLCTLPVAQHTTKAIAQQLKNKKHGNATTY